MMRNLLAGLALCGTSLLSLPASAMVDSQTLESMYKTLNGGNLSAMAKVAEQMVYYGIEDDRLYQQLAKTIEANLDPESAKIADNVAWLSKGLAASGDDKYKPVLDKMVASEDAKLKRYGKESLERLELYKQWNPLIRDHSSDGLAFEKGLYQVYYNMISSKEPELMRIGAKRIEFERISDPLVLDRLRDRLQEEAARDLSDRDWVDAVSWMARALAVSGGDAYRQDLLKVGEDAPNRKIARFATKYL